MVVVWRDLKSRSQAIKSKTVSELIHCPQNDRNSRNHLHATFSWPKENFHFPRNNQSARSGTYKGVEYIKRNTVQEEDPWFQTSIQIPLTCSTRGSAKLNILRRGWRRRRVWSLRTRNIFSSTQRKHLWVLTKCHKSAEDTSTLDSSWRKPLLHLPPPPLSGITRRNRVIREGWSKRKPFLRFSYQKVTILKEVVVLCCRKDFRAKSKLWTPRNTVQLVPFPKGRKI